MKTHRSVPVFHALVRSGKKRNIYVFFFGADFLKTKFCFRARRKADKIKYNKILFSKISS